MEQSIQILIVVISCLMSGFFYCVGGRDKNDKQIKETPVLNVLPNWFFTGIVRDIGCTLCSLIVAFSLYKLTVITAIIFIIIQVIACRSYWSWINELIVKITCENCHFEEDYSYDCIYCDVVKNRRKKQWFNWLLVGLTSNIKWVLIGTNPMILFTSIFIVFASELTDDPIKEEFFRGMNIL